MSLNLTENAKIVLEKRYLLRDTEGQIAETPDALFHRVADFIAAGDLRYGQSPEAVGALAQEFYTLMTRLEFLPNSPTLMNAGKPGGQLSACFVLPVPDSLEAIFDTLKHAALIHQSGGGTGFSFARLRPRGDQLKFTSGITSGPISFMEVYNAATEAIKQGGTRRGANMGILRIDHPDIEEFIAVKNDLSRLTNFNISVAVTDAFMEAVKADKPFDLIHPNTKKVTKTLPARDLMRQIVDCAWQTGEPGLVFIDRINADNVTPGVGAMEATNPCGEVPLLPYEACNLGSINLGKMITQSSEGVPQLDWARFKNAIQLGVHFLDNVITQNTFPIAEIQGMVEGNRKIGLGLMGWADALVQLGIPYNSEAAITLAGHVMSFLNYHAKHRSMVLAQARGRFPFFNESVYKEGDWLSRKFKGDSASVIPDHDWADLDVAIAIHGLRNATTLCLAPTGTISIIAGASGGIEPLYALVFQRNVMERTELIEINPFFESALKARGLYSEALMQKISGLSSIQAVSELPNDVRHLFVTAHDISPTWHVRMQAAFQRHSDNAVSKTINFPESATPEQIEETYELAYDMGLKGITVYRDNSRMLQPMSVNGANGKPAAADSQHCPECHQPLQLLEGCLQCPDCHYAYCG
jgi:ribonucleoside-diphosphate reductase alpha chain